MRFVRTAPPPRPIRRNMRASPCTFYHRNNECAGRRLIHAIVDNKKRIETPGEGHRRRRVVPEDVIADLVFQEEFIEQERLFYRGRFGVIRPLAQTRRHDKYSAIAPPDVQPLNRRAEDRFLYEENAPFAGRPAHQVLWSLAREIPSQARQANYVRRIISLSSQQRHVVLFSAVACHCNVIHNLNSSNECASIFPRRLRPQGRRCYGNIQKTSMTENLTWRMLYVR